MSELGNYKTVSCISPNRPSQKRPGQNRPGLNRNNRYNTGEKIRVACILGMFISIILSFTLISACSGETDSTGSDCSKDGDCLYFEVCKWDQCKQVCSLSDNCPDGQYCHSQNVCTQCASHNHCSPGNYCKDGECIATEESDVNPGFGLLCEKTGDCLNGEICLNGFCTQLCIDESDTCRPPRSICNSDHICVQCMYRSDCIRGATCIENRCVELNGGDGDDESVLAGPNEGCYFEGNQTLPKCADQMDCLFNSSKTVSFCSPLCQGDDECLDDFTNGCCGSFDISPKHCLPESYCDILNAK